LACVAVSCANAFAQESPSRVLIEPVRIDASSGLSQAHGFSETVLHQEVEAAFVAVPTIDVFTDNPAELDAIIDAAVNRGQVGRLRTIGVDYLIIPTVQAAELSREAHQIPAIAGQVRIESNARLRMRVRIIDASTGELDEPLIVDVDWEGEPEIAQRNSPRAYNTEFSQADFVAMSREAGRRLVDAVVDVISPVMVVARDGEEVWLSRGRDGGYELGDRLRIMSADGEVLIHPTTREVLGTRESQLGIIEITDIQARVSVGRIVEESGLIDTGALVRPLPSGGRR